MALYYETGKKQKWIYHALEKKPSRGSKVSQTDFPMNASLGAIAPSEDKSILAQKSEFPQSQLG
jgi:hypothetical protein